MKKLTILVDMDDTIEHLLQAWIDVLNKRYGYSVALDDCLSWDVTKAFPGLSKEQVYSVPVEEGFWDNVKPIDGAAEVLKGFIDSGHDVYIVTATVLESAWEKFNKVLFRYFPFITPQKLIVTWNKKLIKGDVLIDDGVHNLEGADYIKILVDMPYNRSYNAEANGMIRVYNWKQIEEEISKIANNK